MIYKTRLLIKMPILTALYEHGNYIFVLRAGISSIVVLCGANLNELRSTLCTKKNGHVTIDGKQKLVMRYTTSMCRVTYNLFKDEDEIYTPLDATINGTKYAIDMYGNLVTKPYLGKAVA